MIRSFILALVCSVGLFSQDLNGTFIGFSGGANSNFQCDVGLSLLQNGYTAYGLHVSADSQPTANEITITGAKTTTVKTEASGFSVGFYTDFGRAVMAVGVNFVTEKDKFMKVDSSGFNNLLEYKEIQKKGGYIKVGYKVHNVMLYAGYSSYYKASVGVGFIF